MPQDGTKNLRPVQYSNLSQEEVKAINRKGGINSGKTRRKKAEEKDRLKLLLSLPVKDNNAIAKLKAMGLDAIDIDNNMLVDVILLQKALSGDVGAIKYLDERRGKNPQLEIKKQELELKKKQTELLDDKDNETFDLLTDVLDEVKKQSDEINRQAGRIHTEGE